MLQVVTEHYVTNALANVVRRAHRQLLIVMLAMAIVAFQQLGAIDRDAKSQQQDSMPRLYCATAMRAA
ncbi:hypothetical protein [Paraburkholderia fynbosensis]|uniref:Uncharacterized protein n=1 Tax=Paraburkholderia fynbosensis TaxID=1200993 RepID=A0A6J5G050_9BURK|nr:hypothetical protein [Paraburkholderia fynbosensis]CAB3790198.1 hypothetical protein LMG27177_02769 [Paraburkholderia fynbosensis]